MSYPVFNQEIPCLLVSVSVDFCCLQLKILTDIIMNDAILSGDGMQR